MSISRSEKRRQRLFQIYSTNLKLIIEKLNWKIGFNNDNGEFEEVHNPYICPICTKLFNQDSLNQTNKNPLTLEDVPPSSLGGKPVILTCKYCNNNLGGSKLESQLNWDLGVEPFMKGIPNSEIDANYEINKRIKTKGKLVYLDKRKFWFKFHSSSNPNLNQELEELKNHWQGSTIKLNFQAPNKRIVSLALLRIAYLKMCSLFGYGYFLNSTAKTIRSQLFEPEKRIIPNFVIPNFETIPDDKIGICFVKSPPELRSFFVSYKFIYNSKSKIISVLIPGPEDNCMSLYRELQKFQKIDLNLIYIPEEDYLTDKNKILMYNEIWKHYNNE